MQRLLMECVCFPQWVLVTLIMLAAAVGAQFGAAMMLRYRRPRPKKEQVNIKR